YGALFKSGTRYLDRFFQRDSTRRSFSRCESNHSSINGNPATGRNDRKTSDKITLCISLSFFPDEYSQKERFFYHFPQRLCITCEEKKALFQSLVKIFFC